MSLKRTVTDLGNLFLILQIWAMSSVRADIDPPRISISIMDNFVTFSCTTFQYFDIDEWVLYRNSILENTTDPCINSGNFSNSPLKITSECDGLFSCAVEYSPSKSNTGFVLSQPIPVYGNKCGSVLGASTSLM